MSLPEFEERIRSRIWEAVAKSGADLSALSAEQKEGLVAAISAGVLDEVDQLLDSVAPPVDEVTAAFTPPPLSPAEPAATRAPDDEERDSSAGADEPEEILWEGRPFMSLRVRYQITSERVRVVEGMVGKMREDIELVRVQDIDQTQGVSERMLGVGDIHIQSHDPSSPELVLRNVRKPIEVHEILRRAVLNARKRHRLSYREEM